MSATGTDPGPRACQEFPRVNTCAGHLLWEPGGTRGLAFVPGCLVTLGRSKPHCQQSRSLCSSARSPCPGTALPSSQTQGGGLTPGTRLPVQPRRSSWQGPRRKRAVSPGSEAGHTLPKNEKVGQPGSSLCLQSRKLRPGSACSSSDWEKKVTEAGIAPRAGGGGRAAESSGVMALLSTPSENTREKGHPEKHEHGPSGRCQILPSPPLVSNEGANQMIQPHKWQCLSSTLYLRPTGPGCLCTC